MNNSKKQNTNNGVAKKFRNKDTSNMNNKDTSNVIENRIAMLNFFYKKLRDSTHMKFDEWTKTHDDLAVLWKSIVLFLTPKENQTLGEAWSLSYIEPAEAVRKTNFVITKIANRLMSPEEHMTEVV